MKRLCTGLLFLLVFPAGAASCSVSTPGLAFGNYDRFALAPLDSAADLMVTCDVAATYSVALSSGGGSFSNRRLSGRAAVLFYNLYVDVPRVTVWGDGSSATSLVSGNATPGRHTVYARVPARQNVGVGQYLDNVVVTVSY